MSDRDVSSSQMLVRTDRQSNNFHVWLAHGQAMGWVSEMFCASHDSVFDDDEAFDFQAEEDPCLYALRVWTKNI